MIVAKCEKEEFKQMLRDEFVRFLPPLPRGCKSDAALGLAS